MRRVCLYLLILISISACAKEPSFKIEVSHVIEKNTTSKHINSEQVDYRKTIYLVNELNVKVDSLTLNYLISSTKDSLTKINDNTWLYIYYSYYNSNLEYRSNQMVIHETNQKLHVSFFGDYVDKSLSDRLPNPINSTYKWYGEQYIDITKGLENLCLKRMSYTKETLYDEVKEDSIFTTINLIYDSVYGVYYEFLENINGNTHIAKIGNPIAEKTEQFDNVTAFGISPLFSDQKFFIAYLPNEYGWVYVSLKAFMNLIMTPNPTYTYEPQIRPYFKNEAN